MMAFLNLLVTTQPSTFPTQTTTHIEARVAVQGSSHHASCCWHPYVYSTPVIWSRHSIGTGFIALMKSSEPSAPQQPT